VQTKSSVLHGNVASCRNSFDGRDYADINFSVHSYRS